MAWPRARQSMSSSRWRSAAAVAVRAVVAVRAWLAAFAGGCADRAPRPQRRQIATGRAQWAQLNRRAVPSIGNSCRRALAGRPDAGDTAAARTGHGARCGTGRAVAVGAGVALSTAIVLETKTRPVSSHSVAVPAARHTPFHRKCSTGPLRHRATGPYSPRALAITRRTRKNHAYFLIHRHLTSTGCVLKTNDRAIESG